MKTTETEVLVVERIFNAPIEKVWQAITQNEEMKHWFFELAEFKPEVGFEFQFKGGKDDRVYLHLCKVTEAIPNKKLKYSWRYDGYEGISFVTIELVSHGKQTKLKLIHEGLESFQMSNPDFAKKNFSEGWNYIIHTSLHKYLEPVKFEK